jgi:hypothetical protein
MAQAPAPTQERGSRMAGASGLAPPAVERASRPLMVTEVFLPGLVERIG